MMTTENNGESYSKSLVNVCGYEIVYKRANGGQWVRILKNSSGWFILVTDSDDPLMRGLASLLLKFHKDALLSLSLADGKIRRCKKQTETKLGEERQRLSNDIRFVLECAVAEKDATGLIGWIEVISGMSASADRLNKRADRLACY